jgi:hypothetical protein
MMIPKLARRQLWNAKFIADINKRGFFRTPDKKSQKIDALSTHIADSNKWQIPRIIGLRGEAP